MLREVGADTRAGISEYWILRLSSRDVFACSNPDSDLADFAEVRHFSPATELLSPTLPIRVPVENLLEPLPDSE